MNSKIESTNFLQFFRSLPEFNGTVDEVFDSITLTNPVGLENTEIAIAKKDGKIIIIFILSILDKEEKRYYTPEKIEMSTKDYETDGKNMRSYRVDDKFWFFEEQIIDTSAFYGTDMNAPFIRQQNWNDITSMI